MDRHDWDRRYEAKELVWTAEPNRFLVSEVAGLAAGSALDLAAGEGRNAAWLAEQGWDVTAVDFSAVGLAKARDLAATRGVTVTTVCADATSFAPAGHFDLVIVFYLQLPAEGRRAALRRAAEAVATGGTLVVVGHDSTNLADGHGGPQDPAVLFSADEVVADIADSGLAVERAERVERPVETPDGTRIAIDALVRARRPAGARDRDEGGEAPCMAPLFDDTAEGVVTDLGTMLGGRGDGVHWTLTEPSQLNANLVRLGPGGSIGEHVNGEVDVLVIVLAGAGRVVVDGRPGALHPAVVAHVPRGTRRRIDADDGDAGLTYVTVHVRRGPLTPGRPRPPGDQ